MHQNETSSQSQLNPESSSDIELALIEIPESEVQAAVHELAENVSAVPWVEIRCSQCNKIRGKFAAHSMTQVKGTAKVCIEAWCKNCKVCTYRLIVV